MRNENGREGDDTDLTSPTASYPLTTLPPTCEDDVEEATAAISNQSPPFLDWIWHSGPDSPLYKRPFSTRFDFGFANLTGPPSVKANFARLHPSRFLFG
ncbi:uncharacterized protein BT62DRAFT_1073809 [Guyanagaster necrorhizus]|uniref:Uncharacterized protein n=1 Tax=Guyanagaster necrorhizus TaxID=856835 RepID=A0A9P7VYL7_9AGAR|nr:uncharacterized protein BT62DRAFT_1073809 [Guyanagaster necrorhizus MCA 3950]KAG7449327.1 hypothetical protein BT62DRAFT_1073809 [Guyanagaster necrorhizus MCA 3950]